MAMTTTFVILYTTLRKQLRDPVDGGTEGSTPRWTLTEKKQAINDAIVDAFPIVRVSYVDETTVTLATNTFEYSLAALTTLKRAEDLAEVWLEPATGSPWLRKEEGWYCREANGTLKLYVDEVWTNAKKLRLVYVGAPASLTDDANTTIVPSGFVLARTKFYLHSLAVESASNKDVELHIARANQWWQISQQMLMDLARLELRTVPDEQGEAGETFASWSSVPERKK